MPTKSLCRHVFGDPSAHKRQDLVISLLIACFPLAWLAFFNKTFAFDWNNHLWMIAYTGEYFRHHLSFPSTLNTNEVIGIPISIFYGSLLYPVAGLVSALTGAAIALRVIAVALFWLQCTQVAKLVRAVYPGRDVAWAVAAVVSFAVYPLTNLYNRSAITELVAVSLLVSACSIWLRVIYTSDGPDAWASASFAWLLLTLSAGSHPITAVLGGVLFCLLLVGGFVGAARRRALARVIVVNAPMFLVVLSPWLYATLTFHRDLWITSLIPSVKVYSDSIDLWWIRLFPIPFDIRPLRAALGSVSTAYLDAQINFGLLIIVCFLVFQVGRRVRRHQMPFTREAGAGAVCLGLFALVCYGSTSISVWSRLPQFLAFFQFAYRLVTYCDLFLLAAVVVLLSSLRPFHEELRRPLTMCLAAAVAVMTLGVPVKFAHAAAVQRTGVLPGIGIFGERETLAHLPGSVQWPDYGDRTGFAGVLADAPVTRLSVGTGKHFGQVDNATSPTGSNRVATNIEAFPWNRVVLDGREVPLSETYTSDWFLSAALAVNEPSVNHVVGYKFSPDRLYTVLRTTSGLVLAGWAGGLLLVSVRRRRRQG